MMHSSKLTMRAWWLSVSFLVVLLLGSTMAQEDTNSPSAVPSVAPSMPDTEAPSMSPSMADVETEAPSYSPSATPSEGTPPDTNPPTMGATMSPAPSYTPSATPTELDTTDSEVPSMVPSSLEGTEPPSLTPSYTPSDVPSLGPSYTPSNEPTDVGESQAPTATAAPTASPQVDTLTGLKMNLIGLSAEFEAADETLWETETVTFVEAFYKSRRRYLRELQNVEVSDLTTTIDVEDTQVVQGENGANQLEVTYTQELTYNSEESLDAEALAREPFSAASNRLTYTNQLKDAGEAANNDVFDDLLGTTPVQVPDDDDDGDDGLSTGAIIGIACGGAAGLILLVGGYMYFRKKRSGGGGAGGGYLKSDEDVPPSSLQLSGARGDEVSTLGDPKTKSGVASGDEFTGYGDQSVATVDYDYSKAYGGAGESVSSAGGTFGSNTQGQASMAAGIGAGAALGAAGASSYSDDESFDAQYRADRKEEVIDVYAPAGKLGVVIDTPDDGPPVVHAIKDSSVIADKLQVGDMLIAVDEEDVRSMTAIKVSKLISRKSGNATRKLTVVRRMAAE